LESEKRINTLYRAPRIAVTVTPKFVIKTPHRSMAATTEAEDMATTIFLTPLIYDEQSVKSG
jgi:hypothetical protein